MKKEELRKKLRLNNVPENIYNLDETGRKDERFCMEFAGDSWHIYFTERGIKTTEQIFDTEDEACQYLYEQLLD